MLQIWVKPEQLSCNSIAELVAKNIINNIGSVAVGGAVCVPTEPFRPITSRGTNLEVKEAGHFQFKNVLYFFPLFP